MNQLNKYPRIDAIYKRVSCRSFIRKEIPKQILEEIINAGTMAPASGNMQPWEFIIIDEPEAKEKVVKCTFSGFYSKGSSNQHWIEDASIIIIPCVNFKRTVARYGDLGYKLAPLDTTSAVQNMLLAATELGISGCWVGGFLEKKIRNLLQLPPYVQPLGLVPMGYPAKETDHKQKMDAKWVVHKNIYNTPYFN